ncbi:RtcB family protein, partial [Oceanidesulfovibrio marinus]
MSPDTRCLRGKAGDQLGTGGSGKDFAELGALSVHEPIPGVEPGTYIAMLSHSGSRGVGGEVAKYYESIAQQGMPQLPQYMRSLALLPLSSPERKASWAA